MLSLKRIGDVGYKLFSCSMMVLTVYGGYLTTLRVKRYLDLNKQSELEGLSENTASDTVKE